MRRRVLRAKIHRCQVTGAEVDYVGSLTLDRDLAAAASLVEGEFVHVWNVNNGARFETYILLDEPGSRTVCVNGAAALLVSVGDLLIIAAEGLVSEDELREGITPRVVLMGPENRIQKILGGEIPGPTPE